MRDLMIGYGEDLAVAKVDQFAAKLLLDGEPALFAEQAVQMDRSVHLGDAVFGEQHHVNAAPFEEVDQVPDDFIDLMQVIDD